MPEDFASIAQTMLRTELMRHFRATYGVIDRWLKEAGVDALVYVPKPPVARPKGAALGKMGHAHRVKLAPTRIKTIFDDAADDLRRERFLVNRCNEKGGFDPKGAFWRVGWTICTPDELLARATKYRRAA